MTHQSPIGARQSAEDQATVMACHRALRAALDAAERVPDGQRMIGEALCAALDTVGGGAPQYSPLGDMRDDAQWWADCATPMELEVYAAAALRRIKRTTFAERARKRLFWAMWEAMSEADRKAFLAKVKPP